MSRHHAMTLLAAVPPLLSTAAPAETGLFRAWLDAPDSAIAGESFTVTAWVTFQSHTIDLSEAYFGWIETSIVSTSDDAIVPSFSEAYGHFTAAPGDPGQGSLPDVVAWQIGPWGFNKNPDTRPAVEAFSFDVSTTPDANGELVLSFAGSTAFPASPHLGWYLEFNDPVFVDVETPGIDLSLQSAVVRIIPGPPCVMVFALAPLGVSRRRR